MFNLIRNKMRIAFIFLCLLPLLSYSRSNDDGINLIASGKSSYSIVVPADATASENYTASQLQSYLLKISGVKLELISEAASAKGKKYIFVGLTNFVKTNTNAATIANWGRDGILIKTLDGNLIISGGRPRGALNALYQFLENYLECRWWTPKNTYIPKKQNIQLNAINVNYVPPFNYRNHFIYNTTSSPVFASTLRENGDDQKLTVQQGGNEKILGFVHTFSKILPPNIYFRQHPEWYCDPNNHDLPSTSRSKEPESQITQLCMTNEALYKEFLKNTLKWVAENPSYNIVSISQNDYRGYCHCDACQKVIKEEGSPSGPLLRFVNRIANEIGKRYPNKKIETLAYYFSLKPPTKTKPAGNVIIRIAPITLNFAYPLSSAQNADVKNIIIQWAKISKENYYWDYNTNFRNLILPHPSFDRIGDDLKFLSANNVKGVFIQDNKYTDGFGYFLDMQAWVVGHLLWNPNLDQKKLTNEFMTNYYGAGGNYLSQYMNLINTSFRASNKSLTTFNTDYSFITLNVLNNSTTMFNNALKVAKTNNTFYDRVMKEKTAFDFAWLYFYNPNKKAAMIKRETFLGPANYSASVDSLFDRLKKYNVKNIDRTISNDNYKRKLLPQSYSKNEDISNSRIVIQQTDFKLYKEGTVTGFASDNNASDKLVATVDGTSEQWAIQALLGDYKDAFDSNSKWTVTAFVDVDLYKPVSQLVSPGFVNIGIYDTKSKKNIAVNKISVTKLAGVNYTKLILPPVILSDAVYIWVSIVDKNGNVNKLKVDKIELNRTN
ncbi:DUF4838 domain-containing protein [Pedobacter panaciterrae]|nr:DUF4838 domain-containing protein [Pedobacter panaciterrae]